MNENINLCELLKGHEGETFYSPIFGNIKFTRICNEGSKVVFNHCRFFYSNGKYYQEGDCVLFPSKDQRDWNQWVKQQKLKIPKIWYDLIDSNKGSYSTIQLIKYIEDNPYYFNGHIHKSALTLLKIHQLIEVGYGGNITNEEWDCDDKIKYTIEVSCNNIVPSKTYEMNTHIAFHTAEQRDEFMSYPENVQLVKDFYQIP